MINTSLLDKIKNSKNIYIFFSILCIAYFNYVLIIKVPSPYYLITIAFATVFTLLVFKNIKYGIIGFIIVSIFPAIQSKQMFGLTGLNAMNIIFLAVVLRYFLDFLTKKLNYKEEKLPILKYMGLIFILQFIFWIRLIHTKGPYFEYYFTSPKDALNMQFLKPLEYYVILYIMYKTTKDKKDVKIYFYFLYVATLIGMIYLFLQYVIFKIDPYSIEMWRNTFAGHKNVFGIIAAIMCLISISFYLHENDYKMRLLVICGGFISSVVLIYSLSRNAWASFLIAFLYFLYKEKKMKAFLISFFIFLLVILTPLSDMVLKRATRGFESGDLNVITAGRLKSQWTDQWRGIKKNPIFGGGGVALRSHNGYLSIWNKVGIFGLIISFIIFYKMFKLFLFIFNQRSFKGTIKAFSSVGLSCIVFVLFTNITGNLQIVIAGYKIQSVFLIMFIYISSFKLLMFEKEKYDNI